jgi:hypothetical protein
MKAYAIDTGLPGLSDFLHSEYDPTYTTDTRVVLAGSGGTRSLPALCLVAAVMRGAATVTPGAVVSASGGTPGNGSIGTVTADADAQAGDYQMVFIEPQADLGVFQLFRPDGILDGTGKVGTAYNGMLNFTQADGSNNFVEGDRRTINVAFAAGSGKLVRWNPAGTDGSQTILGVNCFAQEAPDGVDGPAAPYLARGPVVGRKEALVWHSGVTDNEKAIAYAALSALGIECRTSG